MVNIHLVIRCLYVTHLSVKNKVRKRRRGTVSFFCYLLNPTEVFSYVASVSAFNIKCATLARAMEREVPDTLSNDSLYEVDNGSSFKPIGRAVEYVNFFDL